MDAKKTGKITSKTGVNPLSSTKCDFKFVVGDLVFAGNVRNDAYDWVNTAPNLRMNVQSSKCDWSIKGQNDFIASSVRYSPEFTDLVGKFANTTGRISSDKCDFSISAVSPNAKMAISSDKCDWLISANTLGVVAQTTLAPSFLEMRSKFGGVGTSLNSDKCDYLFTLKRPEGHARVSSSKCDWEVAATENFTNAAALVDTDNFQLRGNNPAVGSYVSSSKCDWLSQTNATVLPANFKVSTSMPRFASNLSSTKCDFQISALNKTRLSSVVESQTIGTRVNLSSSKCDWQIRTIGGDPTLTERPTLDARLSASKCDFVFNISLGLSGQKSINIHAVSSNKCDFIVKM